MTAITAAHIAIQNVIGRVKFMDAIPAPVNRFCCINLDPNYHVGPAEGNVSADVTLTRDTGAEGAERGERLSSLSSGLPWPIVPEDGVEDGEQLSSDGDEGDHFGFAGCDQAVEEGFQDGIVLFADQGAHEQDRANVRSSAPDEAFAQFG
jgi:hypothetical protein